MREVTDWCIRMLTCEKLVGLWAGVFAVGGVFFLSMDIKSEMNE